MRKELQRLKYFKVPETQGSALLAANRYVEKSRSDNTWRAYRADWAKFLTWCEDMKLSPLPANPETVAMFLAQEADTGLSPSTIRRRLSAIRIVHLGMEEPSPHDHIKVVEVMRGIIRSCIQPPKQKTPILEGDIKRMVDAVEPETRLGLRNRALLLFGFAGAFRRSELVALNTWDLREEDRGIVVTVTKSKTDQEGTGQKIAVPTLRGSAYCPVQALNDWIVVAELDEGPVFRRMFRGDTVGEKAMTAQSVALVIKDHSLKAGLDPKNFSGHSLRSGFLTSAAKRNADLFKMADQSRHKNLEMVRRYVREEDMFTRHAGAQFFIEE